MITNYVVEFGPGGRTHDDQCHILCQQQVVGCLLLRFYSSLVAGHKPGHP